MSSYLESQGGWSYESGKELKNLKCSLGKVSLNLPCYWYTTLSKSVFIASQPAQRNGHDNLAAYYSSNLSHICSYGQKNRAKAMNCPYKKQQ